MSNIFQTFETNDEWLGFGYIGGRINALDGSDPESPSIPETVAQVDALVLAQAATLGWTDAQLFEWANSRLGRWFADAMFGGGEMADSWTRWGRDLVRLPT